jgi:hypothetical protein
MGLGPEWYRTRLDVSPGQNWWQSEQRVIRSSSASSPTRQTAQRSLQGCEFCHSFSTFPTPIYLIYVEANKLQGIFCKGVSLETSQHTLLNLFNMEQTQIC